MSFYVTTPIYYVNAAPHLGHVYTTIAADILARHHKQKGEEVFFLTGTDEHGEPAVQAAEKQGITPRELGDRNAPRFREAMELAGAEFDFFIRTTDPEHEAKVAEILQRVYDNGHVYAGKYEGWYCPRCADFKSESEIAEGNTCPIHHIALEWQEEDNWFFRLSSFQERLEQLYADNPEFVMPRVRANEAKAFIAQGLQDVSLSRAKITWGVTVPWDPSQVFYVWFDALLNYVTALSYARPGEDLTAKFWPADLQLIGKDIIKFHGIYWPAMLMAAGLEPPKALFAHGFLLSPAGGDGDGDGGEGATQLEKMSKSRGNVIDPFEVIEQFGADALRFYLFREVSFGQDGPVSQAGFATRYETELANEYGNLANRTLAMIGRYRDGVVPDIAHDATLDADFDGLAEKVGDLVSRAELTAALDELWQRVRRLNRYVEEKAPWQLARDDDRAGELDVTLRTLAEGLRVVTVLLHPYMPPTAEKLLAALGRPDLDLECAALGARPGGGTVQKLDPLFPKR
jgi:methionyl-tRNA synthetase